MTHIERGWDDTRLDLAADGVSIYANSGGPMSRTRSERVKSTLLGRDDRFMRCPSRMQLALDFGDEDPWNCMHRLLRGRGLSDPEELRNVYATVPPAMLCALNEELKPLVVATAEPDHILAQAFLLGLCTAVYYDPARPVVWTRASLTRRVELFDTGGFYA